MSSEAQPNPQESSPAAIRVRGLSKAYRIYDKPSHPLAEQLLRRPRHCVLHAPQDVSFDVKRGECVGVVGANGAGKTTLLLLISGTLSLTSGSIEFFGRVSSILGL